MSTERNRDLVHMTRTQIIGAIESDLEGRGESLMKEVFEHCDGSDDLSIVYEEMRRIAAQIRTGRSYSDCRAPSISMDAALHARLKAHSIATGAPMAQLIERLFADLPGVPR